MADREYKLIVECLRSHLNLRDPRNVAVKRWLTGVWQEQRDVRTELLVAETRTAEAEAKLLLVVDELRTVREQFEKYVTGNSSFHAHAENGRVEEGVHQPLRGGCGGAKDLPES